ncbi:MAG: IS701 family transposase [Chloroflexi bacterium]|nr:IS701 family transposase [Chloroflexota bacterium]
MFGRIETQQRSLQYLLGLLHQQLQRRNAENLAEVIEGASPRALQRVLSDSPWATEPVIDALQAYLAERLARPDAAFLLLELCFPKKGRNSVGVARQYSAILEEVLNCQIGLFLALSTESVSVIVDKRLYLPREWIADRARADAAGIPEGTRYQSRVELALQMLRATRAAGHLSALWVVGGLEVGQVRSFREDVHAMGWWYVVEITSPLGFMVSAAGSQPSEAPAVELAAGDDQRGQQFTAQRVWEQRGGAATRESWLITHRPVTPGKVRHFLSNAPPATPLQTLFQYAALHQPLAVKFQEERSKAGLGDYEVRTWRGWRHHITLSLLARALLIESSE